MCMNSVQVHTKPHHGGKIWRPHHIGKHEKLSLTYIQELITSIVIVVLNVFFFMYSSLVRYREENGRTS